MDVKDTTIREIEIAYITACKRTMDLTLTDTQYAVWQDRVQGYREVLDKLIGEKERIALYRSEVLGAK